MIAATHPADVARKLEEANANFLSSFNDFVCESIGSCQKEVMAAKVPIASYGRVKSALEAVKDHLSGTAQQLLTTEFGSLRANALESMNAQKEQLDKLHANDLAAAVEVVTRELETRAEEAEAKLQVADAEVARLTDRR